MYKSGDVFQGQWQGGYPTGNFEVHLKTGDVYRGGFVRGVRQGKGVMKFANGT